MEVFAKTKQQYVFSNGENIAKFKLEWSYSDNFKLNIDTKTLLKEIQIISSRKNYFDDQFKKENTLEDNFNCYKDVFSKINDFNNIKKFKEVVSVFEIIDNDNKNPWHNSVTFNLTLKDNYTFLDDKNNINEKVEWGYTPIVSKVVFRHTGEMENGKEQILRAQVGGLIINERITYKWYKNGEEIKNETSNTIRFNGVFKEDAMKNFNGKDFNELVNKLTDTYTVDIFYNGKEFINHTTNADKIEPFKLIIKPSYKLSFDTNNILVEKEFINDSNGTEHQLNQNDMNISNWGNGSYNLDLKYDFNNIFLFKLFKSEFLHLS